MERMFHIFALVTTAALVLTACGSDVTPAAPLRTGVPVLVPGPNEARANIHIIVITNGQTGDTFWDPVRNGAIQAGKDMGVSVQYEAPDTFDMAAMAKLIDAAVATKPDGLAVSLPDVNILGPAIRRAIAAGIPVISINSGGDDAKKLGILVHVGSAEYEASYTAGEKLAAAGARSVLCVNDEAGNSAISTRCKGLSAALKKAGGHVEIVAADLTNLTDYQHRVEAAIQTKPDVDGIVAMGPDAARAAIAALKSTGHIGQIKLITFDLSSEVLQAIDKGEILFAIDQQPYLQGYLPVVLLTLYKTNLNTIGNEMLMTGPGFVTKDNVASVMQLAKQGTR